MASVFHLALPTLGLEDKKGPRFCSSAQLMSSQRISVAQGIACDAQVRFQGIVAVSPLSTPACPCGKAS